MIEPELSFKRNQLDKNRQKEKEEEEDIKETSWRIYTDDSGLEKKSVIYDPLNKIRNKRKKRRRKETPVKLFFFVFQFLFFFSFLLLSNSLCE